MCPLVPLCVTSSYLLEEPAVLVTECDGLRLVAASRHELQRRVPDALVQVGKAGRL